MLKLHGMVLRTYINIIKMSRKIIDGQNIFLPILAKLKISENLISQIGNFSKY